MLPPRLAQDPVLKDFLARIAPIRSDIPHLILFGSRARGTHRHDSDYDLLLVVNRRDDAMIDTLYEAVMDVLLAHGRLISLKLFDPPEYERLRALGTPFMSQVTAEGVAFE